MQIQFDYENQVLLTLIIDKIDQTQEGCKHC